MDIYVLKEQYAKGRTGWKKTQFSIVKEEKGIVSIKGGEYYDKNTIE